jgi:hypothetical protein
MRAATVQVFSTAGAAEFNGKAVAELMKAISPKGST